MHYYNPVPDLFGQVVRVARDAGLVALGTLAVDASKVRANASRHKSMSYERMKKDEKRLKAEIGELLQRAEDANAAEDAEFGEDRRGDEMPEGVRRREDRRRVIREAIKRLEARAKENDAEALQAEAKREAAGKAKRGPKRKHPLGRPKPSDQDNFTDPDSRIMDTKKDGFQQCYSAQIAVDAQQPSLPQQRRVAADRVAAHPQQPGDVPGAAAQAVVGSELL